MMVEQPYQHGLDFLCVRRVDGASVACIVSLVPGASPAHRTADDGADGGRGGAAGAAAARRGARERVACARGRLGGGARRRVRRADDGAHTRRGKRSGGVNKSWRRWFSSARVRLRWTVAVREAATCSKCEKSGRYIRRAGRRLAEEVQTEVGFFLLLLLFFLLLLLLLALGFASGGGSGGSRSSRDGDEVFDVLASEDLAEEGSVERVGLDASTSHQLADVVSLWKGAEGAGEKERCGVVRGGAGKG